MKIIIKNGRVIDPANNIDGVMDILIKGEKISKVGKNLKSSGEEIIDATGKIVIPGLVDMHVHLREPGREDKETILSGTRAALKGGVTSILAMPNTHPAPDSAENVKLIQGLIKRSAQCNVYICGAITAGRKGAELVRWGQSPSGTVPKGSKGVIAISDDGASVDSDELMLEAFKKAKTDGTLVLCHSEDKKLSNGGVVNLGFTSTRLGLRGISRESEYKRIERDMDLAKKSGAAVHIMHVSCKESVELIAKAKKKGAKVTAETAPHYFALTDEAVLDYDTNKKMNPPLRCKEDVDSIKKGLKDGTIDAIASDHAPHTENEKEIEFDRAEFGVVGLETELAVAVTELIGPGILKWPDLVEKLSLNPSKILGLASGTLSPGAKADIAIVSPDAEWTVTKESLVSKSKNSAFLGRKLKGIVTHTILAGEVVFC